MEDQDETLARVLAWYTHTGYAASVAARRWGRVLAPDTLPAPDGTLRFDDPLTANQWYDLEWPNLLAAIQAAEKSGLTTATWRLVLATTGGSRRFPIADRRIIATTALAAARRDGARQAEGELLAILSEIERIAGRMEDATAQAQESLAIFRELDDHRGVRIVLNALGVTLLTGREFTQAAQQFESLRTLQHDDGDVEGEAAALFNLAEAYNGMYRHDDAAQAARRSLELSQMLANRNMELVALVFLARAQANNGDTDSALDSAARSVEIAREIDDSSLEAWALLDYGRIQRLAGHQEDALISYRRAVSVHTDRNVVGGLAWSLDGTGNTYRELDRTTDAIPFHRHAVTVAREDNSAWILGVTLDNLATSLAALDEHIEATACRRQAANLIAQFHDPEATARLERMTSDLLLTGIPDEDVEARHRHSP